MDTLISLGFIVAPCLVAYLIYLSVCVIRGLTPKVKKKEEELQAREKQLYREKQELQQQVNKELKAREERLSHDKRELQQKVNEVEIRLQRLADQRQELSEREDQLYIRELSLRDAYALQHENRDEVRLKERISQYEATIRDLMEKQRSLTAQVAQLQAALNDSKTAEKQHADLTGNFAHYEQAKQQYDNLVDSINDQEKKTLSHIRDLFGTNAVSSLEGLLTTEKNKRAISGGFSLTAPINISCTIRSGDEIYTTTLTGCSCPDHQIRHVPCKHMLWLGLQLSLLARDAENNARIIANIEAQQDALDKKAATLEKSHTSRSGRK